MRLTSCCRRARWAVRVRVGVPAPHRAVCVKRLPTSDRGMVTAETAVVLPVLVVLLALLLAVMGHALDYVRVVDAARSAARLAARGESSTVVKQQAEREAPDGSQVEVQQIGQQVQVTVAAPERRILGPITLPPAVTRAVAVVESAGSP